MLTACATGPVVLFAPLSTMPLLIMAPFVCVVVWLDVRVAVAVTVGAGASGGCEAGPELTGGAPGVITLLGVNSGVSGDCSGLTTMGVGVMVGSVSVTEVDTTLVVVTVVSVRARVTKMTGVSEIQVEEEIAPVPVSATVAVNVGVGVMPRP